MGDRYRPSFLSSNEENKSFPAAIVCRKTLFNYIRTTIQSFMSPEQISTMCRVEKCDRLGRQLVANKPIKRGERIAPFAIADKDSVYTDDDNQTGLVPGSDPERYVVPVKILRRKCDHPESTFGISFGREEKSVTLLIGPTPSVITRSDKIPGNPFLFAYMANHSTPFSCRYCACYNAYIVSKQSGNLQITFIQARADIPEGSEIRVNYGQKYVASHFPMKNSPLSHAASCCFAGSV